MTSIFIFTFNCAKESQLPQPFNEEKDTFLRHLLNNNDTIINDLEITESILPTNKPDLLVFNFQELLSNFESFYPDKIHSYLLQLAEEIKIILNERYNNERVKLIGINHLYALGTLIFTTTNHQRSIFSKKSSVSFGIFNSSLKGCLFSQVDFNEQSFIFLNCHLAANEGMWKERQKNLNVIFKKFPELRTYHNPHIFLLGDLNFRCDNYIIQKTIENLKYDELSIRHLSQPLISQLKESSITFQQSFKYQIGTKDIWNEKRNPSWCDRVLYLRDYKLNTKDNQDVKVQKYGSVMNCTSSDHKPVYLLIDVPDRKPRISSVVVDYTNLELQISKYVTSIVDFTIWLVLFLGLTNKGRFIILMAVAYIIWMYL